MNLNWLPVRREEFPVTISLFLLNFLIIAAFTLAKIARDSLFLQKLPAQYLPYVFIGLAGFSALVVFAYGKLGKSASTHRVLVWGLVSTGVSLVLFGLWFRLAGQIAAIPFYFWLGAYGVILISQFWILANERINPRQAKRLFGVIGAGGILGGMLGAGAATMLAGTISTYWFLFVAAVLHGMAGILAARSGVQAEEVVAPPEVKADERADQPSFLADGYVRLLVCLFLVAGVTSGVLDYAFKLMLQKNVTDSGGITSVLGIFYGVQNMVALLAQVGLAGMIFRKFGNRVGAIALPTGILAGGLVGLTLPLSGAVGWGILGTRLYEATLRVSLTKTSWEFLYFPMPDQIKRQAKRFIDVVVNRSGDAVAGVLILILNFLLGGSLVQLTVVILGLAVVWFLLELTTTQAYAKEVSRSLGRLVGDQEEKRISLQDITNATEMTGLLGSSNQAQVLYALDVLESMDPDVVRKYSSSLLEHPSQAVRARTLAILALQGEDIELYECKAELPGADMSGEDAVKVYDETAADRVANAVAAGRVADSGDQEERLIDLMGDEDRDVRRTAYRSAGLSSRRSFVPHLVNRLSMPEERMRVRGALVLYGERIVGMMGDYLQDPEIPISVKTQITTVLVEIGGQHAAYSLFRATGLEMDRRVVNEALRALNRIQGNNPAVRIPRELMLRDLRQEIDRYCRRLVQEKSVRSAADPNIGAFIQRVLNERAEQSQERIFRRVALVYDTHQTLAAFRGYRSDNARLRAQAIEYLDTSLPSDIKNLLLPVLEASSEEEQVQKASLVLASNPPTLMGTLEEFLQSRESWLNTCGLYVIGCRKFKDYRIQVETFSNSQDPIIRETARWALKQLEASEEAK